jgi:hypothetical protein
MWPSKIKIRLRRRKHSLLAQQNGFGGFGPQFFDKMLSLVNHRALINTSVACAVGPSVSTSSTDFFFPNLVFLEFI